MLQQLSKQLVSLAAVDLAPDEADMLILIINTLFADLDQGHSCSVLQSGKVKLSVKKQINLLLKSGLANHYESIPSKLDARPISILQINNQILVYITKYLQYELDIGKKLKALSSTVTDEHQQNDGLELLKQLSTNSDIPNHEQLLAINNCLANKFNIITGGPGTGKTTTITLLLWLLYQSYGADLKIKVCAPTGKASKRIQDSIIQSINNPKLSGLDFKLLLPMLDKSDSFLTIHKLLGYLSNSIYFKHNQKNMLDIDVLIIDESSMVSLPLFSKLLQAIDEKKIRHVILLGDKNQLSSVEEGYVFAAMVNANSIQNFVTSLNISNRSNRDIGNLASTIQNENFEEFSRLINTSANINNYQAKLSILFEKQLFAKVNNSLRQYFTYVLQADLSDIKSLFVEFNRQIILCLTNVGLFGTQNLNVQIEKKVKFVIADIWQDIQTKAHDLFTQMSSREFEFKYYNNEWYSGRPIIILENDYSLELFNGDIGICIITNDRAEIVFENGKRFIPELLPKYQIAYAITIHKSQGSEYNHVNLILCDNSKLDTMAALLSKELLYTGVTRAKTSVSFFAGDRVLRHAISNQTTRNTGLVLML